MAEFCKRLLITFPRAGPSSLIKFHLTDKYGRKGRIFRSKYGQNISVIRVKYQILGSGNSIMWLIVKDASTRVSDGYKHKQWAWVFTSKDFASLPPVSATSSIVFIHFLQALIPSIAAAPSLMPRALAPSHHLLYLHNFLHLHHLLYPRHLHNPAISHTCTVCCTISCAHTILCAQGTSNHTHLLCPACKHFG